MTATLVLATQNEGKLRELRALLADLNIVVISAREACKTPIHVVEDGATFADNALKKARTLAAATGMLTLADDSGLEVDALNFAPGVHSARFAGPHATDADNNAALVRALRNVPNSPRLEPASAPTDFAREAMYCARFRCVLALVDPTGAVLVSESAASPADAVHLATPRTSSSTELLVDGVCEGFVTGTPRGNLGFGYDPHFIVRDLHRTMAELTDDEKNRVSHRGDAFRKLHAVLRKCVDSAPTEAIRQGNGAPSTGPFAP